MTHERPSFTVYGKPGSHPDGVMYLFGVDKGYVHEKYPGLPLSQAMSKLADEESRKQTLCNRPLTVLSKKPSEYRNGSASVIVLCPRL